MIPGLKVDRVVVSRSSCWRAWRRDAHGPAAVSQSVRGEVRASHGVVAAGRTFTVDAGARLMGAGGNAIDGGVASIFAAAVVEISHFGLGGEAPIIIYSARDKRVVVINGQGSAPKAAQPAAVRREGRDSRATVRSARRCRRRWIPPRSRSRSTGPSRCRTSCSRPSRWPTASRCTSSCTTTSRPSAPRASRTPGRCGPTIPAAGSRRSARCSASRISRRRCGPWRRRSRRRWRAARRGSRRSRPGATRSTKDRSRAT